MPKRTIDANRVFNMPWSCHTRDVFLWMLGVGADGYGLQKCQPRVVAAATDKDVRTTRKCVEALIADETLVRYTVAGVDYVAFRNWQENQHVKYAGRRSCPMPPPDVLSKLGEETQEHLRQSTVKTPASVAVAVAVEDKPREVGTNDGVQALKKFPGYEPRDDDAEWLASLAADYPKVNLVAEVHAAADWHEVAAPHKKWTGGSRSVRLGLRNWMKRETKDIEAGRKPAAGTEAEAAQEKQPSPAQPCRHDAEQVCGLRRESTDQDCVQCEKCPKPMKDRHAEFTRRYAERERRREQGEGDGAEAPSDPAKARKDEVEA